MVFLEAIPAIIPIFFIAYGINCKVCIAEYSRDTINFYQARKKDFPFKRSSLNSYERFKPVK